MNKKPPEQVNDDQDFELSPTQSVVAGALSGDPEAVRAAFDAAVRARIDYALFGDESEQEGSDDYEPGAKAEGE